MSTTKFGYHQNLLLFYIIQVLHLCSVLCIVQCKEPSPCYAFVEKLERIHCSSWGINGLSQLTNWLQCNDRSYTQLRSWWIVLPFSVAYNFKRQTMQNYIFFSKKSRQCIINNIWKGEVSYMPIISKSF